MKTQYVKTIPGGNRKVEKRVILIEKYYNEFKPDMSYKEFEAICKTPFVHMKTKLSEDVLYEIKFRYLGKFSPVPSSVLWMLKRAKARYDDNLIEQSEYNKTLLVLTTYIGKNPKPFKRFREKLKPWINI